MGIGVGDEITIRAGGNVDTFNIIGVASYPFDNVWFRVDDLLEFGNLSSPNSAYIILDEEDPSARAVDDNINDIKESLLRSPSRISAEFTNQVELAELITQIIVIFGFTLSLAALLIALVGGIGLLTTLSISVFERQREIGVMRSVGASTTDVAIQFLIEGLIVGLFAWLLAVPLSLLLRLALLELLPFGDEIEVSYPIVTLPVGLIGMLVLVGIASLWPSFSASRKTVSDILRYQ
jgi:putative ABC transport system permease protein